MENAENTASVRAQHAALDWTDRDHRNFPKSIKLPPLEYRPRVRVGREAFELHRRRQRALRVAIRREPASGAARGVPGRASLPPSATAPRADEGRHIARERGPRGALHDRPCMPAPVRPGVADRHHGQRAAGFHLALAAAASQGTDGRTPGHPPDAADLGRGNRYRPAGRGRRHSLGHRRLAGRPHAGAARRHDLPRLQPGLVEALGRPTQAHDFEKFTFSRRPTACHGWSGAKPPASSAFRSRRGPISATRISCSRRRCRAMASA